MQQVHGVDVHVARGPTGAPPEADAAVTAVRGPAPRGDHRRLRADRARVRRRGRRRARRAPRPRARCDRGRRCVRCARSAPGRCAAYLGPCIQPARYEFGAEDLARLVARFGPGVEGRTHDGRPALDIPSAVRAALASCGVDALDDSRRVHRGIGRALLVPARRRAPAGRRRSSCCRDGVASGSPRCASASRPRRARPGAIRRRSRSSRCRRRSTPTRWSRRSPPGSATSARTARRSCRAKVAAIASRAGAEHAGVALHRPAAAQQGEVDRGRGRRCGTRSTAPRSAPRSPAHAPGARVLVQVNVGGEEQKGGCAPGDTPRGRRGAAAASACASRG